jgi:hypothetical protein
MKRIIKDYDTMSDELRELVYRTFPDGISRDDLMTFPTPAGKRLSGVEIHTEDAVYIIKGDFTAAVQKKGFILLQDDDDDDLDAIVEIEPESAYSDSDSDSEEE